jgi:hypothetical protein
MLGLLVGPSWLSQALRLDPGSRSHSTLDDSTDVINTIGLAFRGVKTLQRSYVHLQAFLT